VWKAALAQSRAAAHPGAARRIEASEKKEKKTRSPPKKMAINIRAYSRDSDTSAGVGNAIIQQHHATPGSSYFFFIIIFILILSHIIFFLIYHVVSLSYYIELR
jgi:hypothetical protein